MLGIQKQFIMLNENYILDICKQNKKIDVFYILLVTIYN